MWTNLGQDREDLLRGHGPERIVHPHGTFQALNIACFQATASIGCLQRGLQLQGRRGFKATKGAEVQVARITMSREF